MRMNNGIVRGVVVGAAILTLATAGVTGVAGYGIETTAGSVGGPAAQVTNQVVGGQHAGIIALNALLQVLCVDCFFSAASDGQLGFVELAQCAIICVAAF